MRVHSFLCVTCNLFYGGPSGLSTRGGRARLWIAPVDSIYTRAEVDMTHGPRHLEPHDRRRAVPARRRAKALAALTAFALGALGAVAAARSPAAPAVPLQAQELPPIRNFLQVTPQFCTGGQPRIEHYAKLKADGVKAVLNLRQPTEHRAAEEQTTVEQLGMKYFNIPVVYATPTAAQVDEFLQVTDDPANRPMFIHCTAAIRVGAFWAIRRVLRDGMSVDAALEEAKTVGLTNAPHLEEFARTYIASHQR
jgi:uncharacterized protein (TIGR01244 family)